MEENVKSLSKENLHKEIDLIQACITRVANNSFLLKGWAITLTAVVVALAKEDLSPIFLGLTILIPLISFWYLDAFFLYTEKLYRKMYEWVLTQRFNNNDEKMYDLNPLRFEKKLFHKDKGGNDTEKLQTQLSVMFSKTLFLFYGILVVLTVVIVLFLSFDKNTVDENSTPKNATSERAIPTLSATPNSGVKQ